MTRTGPSNSHISWETKSIIPEDGSRIDSGACQDTRPKGRIRRSMTACNTCRKLKTRCDVDPRGHACRRCLSLRFVWSFYSSVFTYTRFLLFLWSLPFIFMLTIRIKDLNASSPRQQSDSRTMHPPGRTRPLYHQSRNGLSLLNEAWGR